MLRSSHLWLFNFDPTNAEKSARSQSSSREIVKWRCQGKKMQSWPHLDSCPIWDLLQFACSSPVRRIALGSTVRTFTDPRSSYQLTFAVTETSRASKGIVPTGLVTGSCGQSELGEWIRFALESQGRQDGSGESWKSLLSLLSLRTSETERQW